MLDAPGAIPMGDQRAAGLGPSQSLQLECQLSFLTEPFLSLQPPAVRRHDAGDAGTPSRSIARAARAGSAVNSKRGAIGNAAGVAGGRFRPDPLQQRAQLQCSSTTVRRARVSAGPTLQQVVS